MQAGKKESQGPKTFKAIVCQIDCVFLKKAQNIKRFDQKHLSHLGQQDQIDIILFPELAWTGYNVDRAQAESMAVQYGKGEEFQYAEKLAKRTNAYVMFGYIQLEVVNNTKILYDAAAIVDRSGTPLTNTRKTNLILADKLWATKWHSFNSIQLFNRKGQAIKCGLPICYDIMEDTDKPATHNEYKFANYAKAQNCELILFMTSWKDDNPENLNSGKVAQNQWINRITPMIELNATKNIFFLCSDKVGTEFGYGAQKDILFVGSSCVVSLNPKPICTHDSLDKTTEKTLPFTCEFKQ